jgi:hypothetical protein
MWLILMRADQTIQKNVSAGITRLGFQLANGGCVLARNTVADD